jgi:TetR/AcrR family transcriptional regulator, cholesterol catabolism regulator
MKTSHPNRHAKRLAATRAQILEAAAALIAERGFEAATVEEITTRADVAKGTFYYHFPAKEDVAVALARDTLARDAEKIRFDLDAGVSPLKVLRNTLREGANWIEAHPELSRVAVLHALRSGTDRLDDIQGQTHTRTIIQWIVIAAQAAGELRADVPLEVLLSLLTGAYLHTVCLWLFAGAGFPLADRLLKCLALFLEGAQTPRG